MQVKKFFLYPKSPTRFAQHFIFWLGILLLKATIYGSFYAFDPQAVPNPFSSAFRDVLLTLPFSIVISYFTCYFIIAKYFLKGEIKKSIVYFIFSSSTIILLMRAVFYYVINANYDIKLINDKFINILQLGGIFVDLYQTVIALLLLFLLRKNVRNFYEEKEIRKKTQLQNEKLSEKLKQLKQNDFSHILFNNLNNLYALNLEKSTKASDFVLALSTLINFSLFGQFKNKIRLKVLIEAIESYIFVEQTRFGNKFIGNLDVKMDVNSYMIPNLIFEVIDFAMKETTSYCISPGINIKISDKNDMIILNIRYKSPEKSRRYSINKLKNNIMSKDKKAVLAFNYDKETNEYGCELKISSKISTFSE